MALVRPVLPLNMQSVRIESARLRLSLLSDTEREIVREQLREEAEATELIREVEADWLAGMQGG